MHCAAGIGTDTSQGSSRVEFPVQHFFSEWMMSVTILMVTHITSSDIRLVSHLHASLELLWDGLG